MDLKKFDISSTLKVIEKSREYSASEVNIERFVRVFFNQFGGKIEPTRKKGVYRLYTPKEILKGEVKEKYDRITFSKDIAKQLGIAKVGFLAFGHPILDAVIEYAKDENWIYGGRIAIKTLKGIKKPGLLFNFIMRFIDASGALLCEEILSLLSDTEGKIEKVNPKQIPDFTEIPKKLINSSLIDDIVSKSAELYNMAEDFAIEEAKKFSGKVQQEKDRRIQIKRKDAKRFFTPRTKEERRRIAEYKSSLFKGKDMEIAIRAAQRRLKNLKTQYEEVMKRLEEEELVIEEMPELFSLAVILPS